MQPWCVMARCCISNMFRFASPSFSQSQECLLHAKEKEHQQQAAQTEAFHCPRSTLGALPMGGGGTIMPSASAMMPVP